MAIQPKTSVAVETRLTQELQAAAKRLRSADLLNGILILAVVTLSYTLVAVVLDRWLELPGLVRLAGLVGFVSIVGWVIWSRVIRPIRLQVNPRFAARSVEATTENSKNAIINWVDLQDQPISDGIRKQVGQRAMSEVSTAEVNKVGETRSFLWLISAAGFLLLALAVLFFVFKSAPFLSLLKRTYNPLAGTAIATKTEITLEEPQGGDATITSGESLPVRVTLRGSLPETVLMKVRYNPDAPEFEEFPLESMGSRSEWGWKVPPSVLQNGFRYRIVAGDATTAEHSVTVRTKPTIRDFSVKYEYPAYTRLKPEETTDPRLEGYRGTQVILRATMNRAVREARLVLDTQSVQIPGELMPDDANSVQFRIKLEETGNYRIYFTTRDNEPAESGSFPVRVIQDQKPLLTITSPANEEVTLPANGLLKVDGIAADDFGLVGVALKFRVVNQPNLVIAPKKYRDGKSFLRASDGSYPMALEVKDSMKLGELKTTSGQAVKLTEESVLEYWLEATDNDTEPTANVGKSKVQRVRITPPPPPEKQPEQKRDQDERQNTEQKHQEKQDQQQKNEKRDPQQPRPDKQQGEKGEKGEPGEKSEGGEKPSAGQEQPMNPNEKPKPGEENSTQKPMPGETKPDQQPMPGETKPEQKPKPGEENSTQQPMPGETKPDQKPMPGQQNPNENPMSGNNTQPNPKPGEQNPNENPMSGEKNGGSKASPEDKKLQQEADRVQEKLNEKQREGGEAKPSETQNDQPDKPSGEKKPQPKPDAGQSGDSEPKPEPKAGEQGQPQKNASETKPKGQPNKSGEKPSGEEKPNDPMKSGETGGTPQEQPGEEKPKTAPKPGEQKPNGKPEAGQPKANDMSEQKPENPGAEKAEPTAKPNQKPNGQPSGTEKPNPKAGEKPSPEEKAKMEKNFKDAVKDLQSGDKDKQQAARDKLDKMMGKENREAAEKKAEELKNDLNSNDPAKRDAAQKELEKLTKDAKAQADKDLAGKPEPKPGDKPSPEEQAKMEKEFQDAVKDLQSGEKNKQQAARDKLDKMMGKENREAAEKKAEELKNDLNSNDPAKRDAAQKELEKLAKEAKAQADKNQAGNKPEPNPQKPTPEQMEALKKKAEDLNSPDPAKREAAEKAVDDAIGEKSRQELQQDMKDLQSGDPKKAEEAKKRMQDKMNQAKGPRKNPGPGAPQETPGEKLTDDPKNRLKTAELQLKQFEKAKANEELQKELGYTPEQYERFLKGYRDMVNRLKDEVAQTPANPQNTAGPTTIRVGEGGAKAIDKAANATAGTSGSGTGTAPPGYSEAQKKFAEEAAKLRKPETKK
ncbi:MAG: hypothetical protein ACRC8S_09000 [Fimbriiglobus sp.]